MSENYNDDKVKTILESEDIPERLEPQNIKEMLDEQKASGKRSKIKKKHTLRYLSLAAAAALTVGITSYALKPVYDNKNKVEMLAPTAAEPKVESMSAAVSYDDIYSYFFAASTLNKLKDFFSGGHKKYAQALGGLTINDADGFVAEEEYAEEEYAADDYDVAGENGSFTDSSSSMAEAADIPTEAAEASLDKGMTQDSSADEDTDNKEFSDTYSQEEGVLEADIVKTDGNRVFYTNGSSLYIADVNNGKFTGTVKTDVETLLGSEDCYSSIHDMYIYGKKLILICGLDKYGGYDAGYGDALGCYDVDVTAQRDTYVLILNTEGETKLEGYYTQEGWYNDVRLISDGYMYLVSCSEKYLDFSSVKKDDVEKYIPRYGVCGESACVEPDDVMIPREKLKEVYNYVAYTNITALDLNSETPWVPSDVKSIAGYSNSIYCSQANLYCASGWSETEITRFAITDGSITPAASGKVSGYIKDQFSMSEYKGFFRIAATENVNDVVINNDISEDSGSVSTYIYRKNTVSVMDMSMKVVGSVTDIGINEEIKSVNFNGDKAYVVTFRNTDPLYSIDLTDPRNPKVLDELKISGYSTYMQNWTDGLLLGFGMEANYAGRTTGLKLTMFDNSDPDNLKTVDTISILYSDETAINSEAVYERKALYIDPQRNIIGFPVERYFTIHDYHDDQCIYSYEFYSFENGKLVKKGSVENVVSVAEKEDWVYLECYRRAVYIDGYIYVVSAGNFAAVDTKNFTVTDTADFSNKDSYYIDVCRDYIKDNYTDEEIAAITGWDSPVVEKTALPEHYLVMDSNAAENSSDFYSVTFSTKYDNLLGPIIFYLNEQGTIVGEAPRE